MDKLKCALDELNASIRDLENQIENARLEAEGNIEPLKHELNQIREDKRRFASHNDFESVQTCRRREDNLKFKIEAHWNHHSMLKGELVKLKNERTDLGNKIQLKKDQIKRNEEILAQINIVLTNYKKTQNLKKAAIDSKIDPEHVSQWFEWGKSNFNETYSYFYTQILEIDDYFKNMEALKLKGQMDSVIEAYKRTNSLKEASRIAGVSYDTVQYWQEWGSRGFGEENTYFYRKLESLK
ncbi:MAG: hypothetical protein IJ258_03870 [Methanobrevibacter sp.]|uniref:hypothetical protein n=1 Tax=Methanobrevibacter sp. TaxID=66852 RepID=UPI0025E3A748|nr:hypothetical protein [Methanobrevibacter sp.]MBQ8017224.1 hypothetical protein [Methanobrevibacter sp.]